MSVNGIRKQSWILPAVLVLFILEICLLPVVVWFTYADRSEAPNHVLTYSDKQLVWDNGTGIDENGVARLDIFDAEYDSAKSKDGQNVIAPGTEGFNFIRLRNASNGEISYTAVLYSISDTEVLPVGVAIEGGGFADTENYILPQGMNDNAEVIRAVSGTVAKDRVQDFDILWQWDYYEDSMQDVIDTYLGNRAFTEEADRLTVGLWITVSGEDGETELPKTGDDMMLAGYVTLMCISGGLLLFTLFARRKERKECA